MKKLKIIVCIAIIIICLQVTYARFITKEPNGNINAKVGQAIINLEEIGINSTSYDENNVPCLYDTSDIITYSFSVNNYNTNNEISDVSLEYYIYVVFYDQDGNVKSDLDCQLKDEYSNNIESTVLVEEHTLIVNGTSTTLPVGTIKFSPNRIISGEVKEYNTYDLNIKIHIDSLPTSEITPRMEMYCEAEQNI